MLRTKSRRDWNATVLGSVAQPSLNAMTTPPLPEQIELHRDRMWRRDEELRIERAVDAERFIEDVVPETKTGVRPAILQFKVRENAGTRRLRELLSQRRMRIAKLQA